MSPGICPRRRRLVSGLIVEPALPMLSILRVCCPSRRPCYIREAHQGQLSRVGQAPHHGSHEGGVGEPFLGSPRR